MNDRTATPEGADPSGDPFDGHTLFEGSAPPAAGVHLSTCELLEQCRAPMTGDLHRALVDMLSKGETEEGNLLVDTLIGQLGDRSTAGRNAFVILGAACLFLPPDNVEWIARRLNAAKDDEGHPERWYLIFQIVKGAEFIRANVLTDEPMVAEWENDLLSDDPDCCASTATVVRVHFDIQAPDGELEITKDIIKRFTPLLVRVVDRGDDSKWCYAAGCALLTLQRFAKADGAYMFGVIRDAAALWWNKPVPEPGYATAVGILSENRLEIEDLAGLIANSLFLSPRIDAPLLSAIMRGEKEKAAGPVIRKAMEDGLPAYSDIILKHLLTAIGAPVVNELLPLMTSPATADRAMQLFRLLVMDPAVPEPEMGGTELKARIESGDVEKCLRNASKTGDPSISRQANELLAMMSGNSGSVE